MVVEDGVGDDGVGDYPAGDYPADVRGSFFFVSDSFLGSYCSEKLELEEEKDEVLEGLEGENVWEVFEDQSEFESHWRLFCLGVEL